MITETAMCQKMKTKPRTVLKYYIFQNNREEISLLFLQVRRNILSLKLSMFSLRESPVT